MTHSLRYVAEVWVEVDLDEGDVMRVVVDEATLDVPLGLVDSDGVIQDDELFNDAQEVANGIEWPSWGFGPRPF